MSCVDTDRRNFVTELFRKLGSLDYAIERGLKEIDSPLVSDLDVITSRKVANRFIEIARRERLLIHEATAFGGARVFVGAGINDIKRIDFMWLCHYRGIHLLNLKPILSNRKLDPDSGLYALSDEDHAHVLFAVKNAYGGAEKYRRELTSHGFSILETAERRKWLARCFLTHPLRASFGAVRFALAYVARVLKPSGLAVYGQTPEALSRSRVIQYVFQGRVRQCPCWRVPYLARLASVLCVVTTRRCAQLDLSSCESLEQCEQEIIDALRARSPACGQGK